MNIEPIGTVGKISENVTALELNGEYLKYVREIVPGDELDIVYWLHEPVEEADGKGIVGSDGDGGSGKDVLQQRASLRSDPIKVARVEVVRVDPHHFSVRGLDAREGLPLLDIKPARASEDVGRLIEFWGQVHDTVVRALEERYDSQELKEALHDPLWLAGRTAATVSCTNATEIGRAIMAMEKLWGIKGRVLEGRPDRFTREVTECPWAHLTPMSCRSFGWWMAGFCHGSNSRYAYRLDRLMPEGAETCRWEVWERASLGLTT